VTHSRIAGIAMIARVGHSGVFAGKTWIRRIYSTVKNVILQSD
jgi:poly-beta-hydroxyalkanoate depolymerase